MKGKKSSCYKNGHHKGHGWMMILCALLMVGISLFILSSSQEVFSWVYLSSAIVPLIICLAMHGLMMKMMMPSEKQGSEVNEQSKEKIENNPQFKA
jgi:preprotein translocase subunit YajC